MYEPPPQRYVPAFPTPADLERANWRIRRHAEQQAAKELFEIPPRVGALGPSRAERSAAEEQHFVQRFWRQVEIEERATLEDTLPHRVRAGWRIVREMARLKNLVSENELLIEGLPVEPDPWTEGSPYNRPLEMSDIRYQKRYMVPLWDVVKVICGPSADKPSCNNKRLPGLPLLPPPIDEEWIDRFTGKLDESYAPEEDKDLMRWIWAAERITQHYSMEFRLGEQGETEEDEKGRLGVAGMFEPKTCRMAFPTRMQILYYEELLIKETIIKLKEGPIIARSWLYDEYGLRQREVDGVLSVALTELRTQSEADTEEKRALLEHRVNDFIERSKSALDLSNEIKGLKVLSVVQGLTRTEPEDANKEFLDATNRAIESGHTEDTPRMVVIDAPVTPAKG